jgi:putative proteasome-type protease
VRQLQESDRPWLKQDGIDFHCNFLLGGQMRGGAVELYLIYSQGNCIHATEETPYLQIGEAKYGKPILDRVINYETSLEIAAKCALLSLDSTMRSNLSVGPPLRLARYRADSLQHPDQVEFPAGAGHLIKMRREWESSVRAAFERLPDVPWPKTEVRAIASSFSVAEISSPGVLLEGGGSSV